MIAWKKPAAVVLLLSLAACAQPAPPVTQTVMDPYASAGGGALYQGDLAGGTLGAEATAQYFNTTVGNTVLFAANQTALTAEARGILARQAEWLNRHTNFTAVVQGHAEETGTREYNLALGARRASSVQAASPMARARCRLAMRLATARSSRQRPSIIVGIRARNGLSAGIAQSSN